MNKHLEKLCTTQNYDKIYQIIKSKTVCPSVQYQYIVLSMTDFDNLKIFNKEKILLHVHQNIPVPESLIKLSEIMGKEHSENIKNSVINYIVSQYLAELSQYMSANFTDLSKLKLIYGYVEALVERLTSRYIYFPEKWSIDLCFITRAFLMIKQRICEHFYVAEALESAFIQGLFATMTFEKKIQPFFSSKKCCYSNSCPMAINKNSSRKNINTLNELVISDLVSNSNKNFDKSTNKISINETNANIAESGNNIDNKITLKNTKVEIVKLDGCFHSRMLSSIFISCINLLFNFYLKRFGNIAINQNSCRMGIIEVFLQFFSEVQFLYEKITYFKDDGVFKSFIKQVDFYLISLVSKIKVAESINQGAVIIATIFYIQETIQDLLGKISRDFDINCEPEIFTKLRNIELMQNQIIEKLIGQSFINLSKTESNSTKLLEWFEVNIFNNIEFSDEIRYILFEMGMSQLFIKISQIKLTIKTTENLLCDICDIENHFLMKNIRIPHIKSIKDYLKIFMCPTDDKNKFVENFNILSGNIFTFYQILNALENQDDAAELFLAFKKNQNQHHQ